MRKNAFNRPQFVVDESKRADRAFVLGVVRDFPQELEFADPILRADREIVMAAVSAEAESFRWATAELRKDRDFVLQVAKIRPRAIFYAIQDFRRDREIVLEAAALDPIWARAYADTSLKEDLVLKLMVLGEKVGKKIIYANGQVINSEEIISVGLRHFGREALELASHFFPNSSEALRWERFLQVTISDFLRSDIHRHCRLAEYGGRAKFSVDFVFLIDLSSAMSSCLASIKNEMGFMISGLDRFFQELDNSKMQNSIAPPVMRWRLKICGYHGKKYGCDDWWLESPFSNSASSIKAFFESMTCEGNGVRPQPLLNGLLKLARMPEAIRGEAPDGYSWSTPTEVGRRTLRLVWVFSGSSYSHESVNSDSLGAEIEEAVSSLSDARIHLDVFERGLTEFWGDTGLGVIDHSNFRRV